MIASIFVVVMATRPTYIVSVIADDFRTRMFRVKAKSAMEAERCFDREFEGRLIDCRVLGLAASDVGSDVAEEPRHA